MQIKRMVAPDDGQVKRHSMPMDLTPEDHTMTRQELQEQTVRRAEELAQHRHYSGMGKFTQVDYQRALDELSPEERAIERDLAPPPAQEPSQRQLAAEHYVRRYDYHRTQGVSPIEADKLARAEERESGLHEVRAHLPKQSPWAAEDAAHAGDGARAFSKTSGSKIGREMVKTYEDVSFLPTLQRDAVATERALLPRQLAAAVLKRGALMPGMPEQAHLDHWFEANVPKPAPVAGDRGAALAAYNTARETFIAEMLRQARLLLQDPYERSRLLAG